jgi:hypothetical protein
VAGVTANVCVNSAAEEEEEEQAEEKHRREKKGGGGHAHNFQITNSVIFSSACCTQLSNSQTPWNSRTSGTV